MSPLPSSGLRPAQGSVRPRVVFALALAGLLPLLLWSQAPAWWTQRGVLDPEATADDYAAVNQGQVRHIAKQAYEEMKISLSGGAGPALDALWSDPAASTDDYAIVNLGQLKNVAKPFYDRLIEAGVADAYPWTDSPSPADDFALANIGQVKNLFGFALQGSDPVDPADTDGNGLPDAWETAHFGQIGIDPQADPDGDGQTNAQEHTAATDPNDYYNGQPAVLTFVSGHRQTPTAGEYYPEPVVVRLTRADGTVLVNAPLVFTVTGDAAGGGVAGAPDSPTPVETLTVRTNSAGEAQVFWKVVAP